MNNKVPVIKLNATSYFELGKLIGTKLKERIWGVKSFYESLFNSSQETIFKAVQPFSKAIQNELPHLFEEMQGIAEGSNLQIEWIVALNSRTELLGLFKNECTAVYFKDQGILAQNWDWAKQLESLIVVLDVTLPNKRFIMLTEPGIIGKIGMNNHGLGVTLNILLSNQKQYGIPFHVLLRVLIESDTLDYGVQQIKKYEKGKSSNIIFADKNLGCVNLEFYGENLFINNSIEPVWFHTNHYLTVDVNEESEFQSSFSRFRRVNELVKQAHSLSIEQMKDILLDRGNMTLPICRTYIPDEIIGDAGTVCTIIMDLMNLQFTFSHGSPLENEFETIRMVNNEV